MPNTDIRRVKEDYWYTSAQITDVGNAWQHGSPERLFLHSSNESANRCAFAAHHVPHRGELPKKILLPLNLNGSHWTAIAINVSQMEDNRISVNIGYTDSLHTNTSFAHHAPLVRDEIARIEHIFRQAYGLDQLLLNSFVYAHTWAQPDGSSCGAYALANGARCLDNRGQEDNPGRKRIREQQLNMMSSGIAIRGCSTSNAVDEILLDWIIDRATSGAPLQVTRDDDVVDICSYYAHKYHREFDEIVHILQSEYNTSSVNLSLSPNQVNVRVRELIGELGMQSLHPPTVSLPTAPGFTEDDDLELDIEELMELSQLNEPVQQAAVLIAQENMPQKIDALRQILAEHIENDAYVFELMQQLTMHMYRGHQDAAENLIRDVWGNSPEQQQLCFRAISDVIGMRKFAQNNDEKFIYLASAYKSLADAMYQVKSIKLNVPINVLNAHRSLLQGAIDRNNASLLRQIFFAIKDLGSALLESVSGGRWQSDIKRITIIRVC